MIRSYLFVRHAEAAHRAPVLEEGAVHADWPLTARGERQADALGGALADAGATRVVSSSLRRARETARRIAARAGIPYAHAWPELDEISPRTLRAAEREPEWLAAVLGARAVRRSGRADVEAKVRTVLGRLDAMDEERVVVVGHGYWILLMALLVPGRLRLRWVANGSITRVDAVRGGHRLVGFAQPSARALAALRRA